MNSPPKTLAEWKSVVLRDWPSRAILTLLTVFCGYLWSQGKGIIHEKVLDIVQPSLDSITKKQEITDKKLDALISILRKAFPQVEKAAKEKATDDAADVEVKRALIGEPP